MGQRSAAVHLKISQTLLCKILKNRPDIETSALTNENTDRKIARQGKDSQVESALKIWFSNVREKNTSINEPLMRQKLKLWAKKSSVQLMDGLTGGKSEKILCTSICMVQKKVPIFFSS
jgi:hypothetical protein